MDLSLAFFFRLTRSNHNIKCWAIIDTLISMPRSAANFDATVQISPQDMGHLEEKSSYTHKL